MHKTMSNIQRTPLTDRVLTGVGAIESMSWLQSAMSWCVVDDAVRWMTTGVVAGKVVRLSPLKFCLCAKSTDGRCVRRLLVVVQDECWCGGACLNEKFDVVTIGEKLACWQKACSTCADVFVHVDQVALDPVCKLSELLWNELSGHSGWYDRRCPRWRAGDVVPAVSLQWTLLVRQLQLVLSVGTVSSCSREVETTYHWLCWCLFRRADVMRDVDCQIVVCRILSMLVLIDVPWLKAERDDKRTLSVKLLRWGDWNLSWGWGRSHVRFLVVAVPSQSLVVHLPIAERLHHLMTKPDCCLFCVGVALLQVLRLSCTWKLMMRVLLDHRFADETWL